MTGKPEPKGAGAAARGRKAFDDAYLRADSALDLGQNQAFRLLWFFLPDASIARNRRFEQVLASRFFSDAGQQAVAYGALIAVVRGGGSALDASLIGVAALIPPAIFALHGGTIADQLPKRIALAVAYNAQALLCITIPIIFGTDLIPLLALVFFVNLLGQLSGPSESAVLPHVASEQQLASAVSMVSLVSNIGTAFGTAVLAPILVRVWGNNAVFVVSGVLLLLAASRVFDLPTGEPERRLDLRARPQVKVRATLSWLARERAVATMIFVSVLAGSASIVVQTLGPRYVQSVLNVDPADAVYVFGPTSLGLLAALAAGPRLVRRFHERPIAIAGFFITTSVLFLLGNIDEVATVVEPLNPLRLLETVGIQLSPSLRTAGFLSMFLGFGLALTQISVQTYINRRMPLRLQARTFALQSMLKNLTTIVPLLTLGFLATAFGVEAVLVATPFILLVLGVALLWLSYRWGGETPARRLDVLSSYWEESELPISDFDPPAIPPVAAASGPEGGDDAKHDPA